jgi:hypothetical protein
MTEQMRRMEMTEMPSLTAVAEFRIRIRNIMRRSEN